MKAFVFVVILIAMLPSAAVAQSDSDYGQRLQGANGWLLPVATKILGSDEHKHLGRGSVNAWDLVAPNGSAIYAMTNGTVEYAGCGNQGGYGCWVLLKHADGYTSAYGHMIKGSIRVERGQTVDANTLLGQVGWTGMTSFGPHTHFEIRQGGKFQPIRNYFDISAMKQCNLCSVGGKPVAAQGIRTATTASTGFTAPALSSTLVIVLVMFAIISLMYVFAGEWLRNWLYHGMALYVSLITLLLVVGLPVAAPVNAGQQAATIGGDWEKAYQIVQGNEGWKCTNDGAYTMGGVTQGTYNRWRRAHGMSNADVCANLTKEQAKAVFYEFFWLPSGADKMHWNLALTAVDHYYNTGAVKHLLAQCGTDVACFNNARIADYRSKGNCNLYCTAWINRVNKIRKHIGG